MHGLLTVGESLVTITAPAVVTGRAGGDAIFMRCMWRAGVGGTDAGTVMEGPLQPVDRLEWWDFRASSSLDMMQHEDFDRGWRRSVVFDPYPGLPPDMKPQQFHGLALRLLAPRAAHDSITESILAAGTHIM